METEKVSVYEITDSSGNDIFLAELTAEQVLHSLIESGVRFIDTDGKRLRIKER